MECQTLCCWNKFQLNSNGRLLTRIVCIIFQCWWRGVCLSARLQLYAKVFIILNVSISRISHIQHLICTMLFDIRTWHVIFSCVCVFLLRILFFAYSSKLTCQVYVLHCHQMGWRDKDSRYKLWWWKRYKVSCGWSNEGRRHVRD